MSDDKDFTPSTNSTDPKEIKDSLGDIAYCTETLTHLAVETAALIEISEEQGVSLTPRVSEIMNKLEEEKLRDMERLLREIKKEIFDSGLSTITQGDLEKKCKEVVREGSSIDKMRKSPFGEPV